MPGSVRSVRYKSGMKFRTGLIVGLAVGYYFGAKAGRDRFEQIDDAIERLRHTAPYRKLRATADELMDEGRDRALDLIDGIVETPPAARAPQTTTFDAYIDPTLN
jgi:hypothetical protein